MNSHVPAQLSLVEDIRDFLQEVSNHPLTAQLCPSCGKKVQLVPTTFRLPRTGEKWEVMIPICNCDAASQLLPMPALEPFSSTD